MIDKPFSQACENNKQPILSVLQDAFKASKHVLEIGSGTGQHAVFFAANLPHVQWQCADQIEYHEGIHAWMREFPSSNLHKPMHVKLPEQPWQSSAASANNSDIVYDAYFSANTAHIMQPHEVACMMDKISNDLPYGGVFCQYGPFIQNGEFTSESNALFHEKLIATGRGGYRDIAELQAWAPALGLKKVIDMPANNLMLVWEK